MNLALGLSLLFFFHFLTRKMTKLVSSETFRKFQRLFVHLTCMFALCEKEFITTYFKLCLILRVKGEIITKSNIAAPMAYGGFQARGLIGAVATGLHHSSQQLRILNLLIEARD